MTVVTCYDAVDVSALPPNDLYLGYIDGVDTYNNYAEVVAAHPGAHVLTVTVVGTPGARIADCETGDLSPFSAATWASKEVAAGRRPCIYSFLSNIQPIRDALSSMGLFAGTTGSVDLYLSEPDENPIIPSGFVAKQYHWNATPNYDTSTMLSEWVYGTAPTPTPQPPTEIYDMIVGPVSIQGNLHWAAIDKSNRAIDTWIDVNGKLAAKDIAKAAGSGPPGGFDASQGITLTQVSGNTYFTFTGKDGSWWSYSTSVHNGSYGKAELLPAGP